MKAQDTTLLFEVPFSYSCWKVIEGKKPYCSEKLHVSETQHAYKERVSGIRCAHHSKQAERNRGEVLTDMGKSQIQGKKNEGK